MNATPHLIAGRYQVGELLGRGGMAEVRKGLDTRLGRTVAIKRLRTDLAGDPSFQMRFRREATSSASLNHPAIVAVYDSGEEYADDSDVPQPYIVMEYVEGRTLRDILREGRKILPERALEITAEVLGALDYSHRHGIIHRDIKPANVMLTPAGDVKVMDFGIARALADATSAMTQTAAVVGTAQYLSPEQARGEKVDFRSDVYSAGCLMYELLTGRPPFLGDSPVAVAYQHVREQPLPPSTYDDELTPDVDAIALKALAKNLGERYQSASAMKTDIDRALAGLPVQAAAVPAVAAAPEATTVIPVETPTATTAAIPATPLPAAAAAPEPTRRKSRWGLWVFLIALLLAILTAAAVFLPGLLNPGAPQTKVPTVTGMNQVMAENELTNAGLKLGDVTEETSETVKEGDVISSDPAAGDLVDQGRSVNLVISSGKPAVTVPDLVGKTRTEAEDALRALGLRPKALVKESDEPVDQIIETNPGAGESVKAGSRVTIYYSDGPELVPDVVGMLQEDAIRLITEAGFVPSLIEDPTSTEPVGTVVKQSPSANKPAPAGTEITIRVSTGFGPTGTPSASATP